MRKSTSVFIFALVLFSCTAENELAYQEKTTTFAKPNKRSLSEALKIAEEATSILSPKSRNREYRTIDMDNIHYINSGTNSRSQSDDTLLYVINYADDNGFAVVSANSNTAGLIAVTEKGTYSPTSEEINNNGGMTMFIDMAEAYVSNSSNELQNTGPETITEIYETEDTIDTWIEPKLTTQWGQTGLEGRYAPNLDAGCANVAMAQIMTYFEHPAQIEITYNVDSIRILDLDWPEIKKYKGVLYENTANSTARNAISHLLRQLGELNNTNYIGNTITRSDSAMIAMSELGYTVSPDLINYNNNVDFQIYLNNNILICMFGAESIDDLVGHLWVIDGHFEREVHYTAYTREMNNLLWELHDESYTYYRYNHINWGYSGFCNGYFLENVFNMSNASQYDGTINSLNHNYVARLKYFEITK